jgi:hypothetical protein
LPTARHIGPYSGCSLPAEKADYLEIRDYKTSGLTDRFYKGKLDPNDHGNYWKLLFDTGETEQTTQVPGEALAEAVGFMEKSVILPCWYWAGCVLQSDPRM